MSKLSKSVVAGAILGFVALVIVVLLAVLVTGAQSEPAVLLYGELRYRIQKACGSVAVREILLVTGTNPMVSNMVFETVWGFGDLRPDPPGVQLTLFSTSANDTVGGTGARTVRVRGIDTAGAQVFETVIMNGLAGVTTTTLFTGILPSGVFSKGSLAVNDGDITFENGGTVYEAIMAGDGGTHSSTFIVPTGFVAWLDRGFWGTNDDFEINFEANMPIIGIRSLPIEVNGQMSVPIEICYPATTKIRVLARGGTGASSITISYLVFLIRQTDGAITAVDYR